MTSFQTSWKKAGLGQKVFQLSSNLFPKLRRALAKAKIRNGLTFYVKLKSGTSS